MARRVNLSKFDRTRGGLRLVYIGLCWVFGGTHCGLIISAFGTVSSPLIVYGGVAVALIGLIVGWSATVKGQFCCLYVPQQTQARDLIVRTLALRAVQILVAIGIAILAAVLLRSETVNLQFVRWLVVLAFVFDILAFACFWSFIAFVRRLCNFFERVDLVFYANTLVFRVALLAVSHLIMQLFFSWIQVSGSRSVFTGAVAGVLTFVLLAANLIVCIQYFNLLQDLDAQLDALETQARDRESESA